MKKKLKIGQQVRTHMLNYWGMGTIVTLGLYAALVGYMTPTGYYEDTEPYFMLKNYNQHLFKGEN